MKNQESPLDAEMQDEHPHEREFEITEPVKRYWIEIANWSTIFGVIIAVVSLIIYLRLSIDIRAARVRYDIPASLVYFTLLLPVIAGFPVWFFFDAGRKIRHAFEYDNNDSLERGFLQLKRAYRTLGIYFILYLLLLSFTILFSMLPTVNAGN